MINFIIDTICKKMKFRYNPDNLRMTGWHELEQDIVSYTVLLTDYMFNNPNDKRLNCEKFNENITIVRNLRKKLEEVVQSHDPKSFDHDKLCKSCDSVLLMIFPLYYDTFDDIPFYQKEDKEEDDEDQKTDQQPEVVVVVEDSVEKSEETDKKDIDISNTIKAICISIANISWYQIIAVDVVNEIDPNNLHINDIPYFTERLRQYVKEINRYIIESEAKFNDYCIAEKIIYTISEFIAKEALKHVQGKDPNLVHLYEERLNEIFKTIINSTGHKNVKISFNLIKENK